MFDFDNLPSDANITQANLILTLNATCYATGLPGWGDGANNGLFNMTIHRILESWTEGLCDGSGQHCINNDVYNGSTWNER